MGFNTVCFTQHGKHGEKTLAKDFKLQKGEYRIGDYVFETDESNKKNLLG